ncbi:PHAF1 protein CG7083 [Schistocerca americana]|uniref:PHAF1 protein CG7083 n=1 Tax=Schistocerca americana TaxID=7009 RepID=UPI001F4F334A|nr:PHAF1 protein CG7083 [Schistocerca americana]
MLELELVPERSLGCEQWEFILGMHFSQAVAIIQSQVGIIKGVQVLYSDSNPLGADLIINLPQDGIRLIFDPIVQRLKIIEIYNMKLVKVKYCGLTFNSPEVLPSIEQIERSFGATHPGVLDTEKQLFVLNFRGLSFCFPVESKFQPGYAHGLGSLQFPNGSSPVVSRTSVYSGSSLSECRTPQLPLCCYHNHLYLERAEVIRERLTTCGLRLHLFTEGSSRMLEPRKQNLSREVMFGDTCQDVASAIGAPSRVFYKSEDKMKIHSPNAHRRISARRSDFFYNYFTLGIDILFDAKTQKVKKFVLHTNFPGHYNFNMYHRCEFHLTLPPDSRHGSEGSRQLIDVSPIPVTISAYTKWDTISEQLKPSERPVVLNRASSTNTTNPFGSTFCYGYQDIIFEVMPNNYIASVTLYAAEKQMPEV